jgi:hypothetical protein
MSFIRSLVLEPTRFDTLTRSLAAAPSRRGLARVFAGLAVAGPLSALGGRGSVEAKKKHKHKKCKSPKKKCGAKCVAVQSDPRNCGSCGHECANGESCISGQCSDSNGCPAGLTRCGGSCVDLTTDRANCGRCGHGCADGEACRGGVCGAATCPTGQHDCGAQGCRQCCINSHCGSSQNCIQESGTCACWNQLHTCGDDPYVCWSCCTDGHCRPYGRAPEDGFICTVQHACVCQAGSECTKADQSGYFCADLQNDDENCGECGIPCGSWTCRDGMCTPP